MTLAGFYGSEGEQPEMKLGWGVAVGFKELLMPRELSKLREILWSLLWKSCGQIYLSTSAPGAAWKLRDAGRHGGLR